jgi:nicotinate phosphoribosyltransferase
MAYSDFKNNRANDIVYFDVFFRRNIDKSGYSIFGGLSEIVDYIKNVRFDKDDIEYLRSLNMFDEDFLSYLSKFKFSGDVYSFYDGDIIFPNEPCIRVKAPLIEAEIIETDLLNRFNHASLISTKASRIVSSANGRSVMEFGARRAQGTTAAYVGAKYACIAGCVGTSCYESGKKYDLPILGTMAHSQIMKYESEYEAFLDYAKTFPNNSIFLIDTIDTINSGLVNAIKVHKEYLLPNGYRLKGVRLDSGDLAYLSKKCREILDANDMKDCKICASNSLDEYLIKDLLDQGAKIDLFGVGENLITSKSTPVFGGVYKLVAIEENGTVSPRIKISENEVKITNPGVKKVYRFYNKDDGYALADVVTLEKEIINDKEYEIFDEKSPWKRKLLTNYFVKEMLHPIFIDGKQVYEIPSVKESKEYCCKQLETIYPEHKRLFNPSIYYVDLSKKLYDLKYSLIKEKRGN